MSVGQQYQTILIILILLTIVVQNINNDHF